MIKLEIGKYYKIIDYGEDWTIFKVEHIIDSVCDVIVIKSNYWKLGRRDNFISSDVSTINSVKFIEPLPAYNTPLYKLLNGE